MKFSVCLPAVFGMDDLPGALARIGEAGMDRYELWKWWENDIDALERVQNEKGFAPGAICTKFISLTDPACLDDYMAGLRETVAMCQRLGCKNIISQVGQELEGVPREKQHAQIVEGVKKCLPILEGTGVTLLIEPLNTRIDHIGYYLWKASEGLEIVREINHPSVKMLYDIYHQYAMDDLDVDELCENIDVIGHIHVAGYPGRHEPLEGEIDYVPIFKRACAAGYDGLFGLEYMAHNEPVEGLKAIQEATKDI